MMKNLWMYGKFLAKSFFFFCVVLVVSMYIILQVFDVDIESRWDNIFDIATYFICIFAGVFCAAMLPWKAREKYRAMLMQAWTSLALAIGWFLLLPMNFYTHCSDEFRSRVNDYFYSRDFGGVNALFDSPNHYTHGKGYIYQWCVTDRIDSFYLIGHIALCLALGTATYFFIRWLLQKRAQKVAK